MPPPLFNITRRHLIGFLLSVLDAALGFVVMFCAMSFRYSLEEKTIPGGLEWKAGLVFAAVTLIVWLGLRIHRGVWRFTSLNDIRSISQGVFLVSRTKLPAFRPIYCGFFLLWRVDFSAANIPFISQR